MASASSCESILCPVCRKRPISGGFVCVECYGQFQVSPVPREVVALQDVPRSMRVRTMLLAVGLTAVSLAVARQSLLLGSAVAVVLFLTLMLGAEQIRRAKHLGLRMTVREECTCLLLTCLTVGVSLAAFAGAAAVVRRLVQIF